MNALTPLERKLLAVSQAGFPLVARPYAAVAEQICTSEHNVIALFRGLIDRGIVRRIAAATNHYALGMAANGMTVWDVEDERVEELGRLVGRLAFVTHCYRRPRALPLWPYNLFAMVHGVDRQEVERKRTEIAALLKPACGASDVLYSTRILKKAGLRLTSRGGQSCSD